MRLIGLYGEPAWAKRLEVDAGGGTGGASTEVADTTPPENTDTAPAGDTDTSTPATETETAAPSEDLGEEITFTPDDFKEEEVKEAPVADGEFSSEERVTLRSILAELNALHAKEQEAASKPKVEPVEDVATEETPVDWEEIVLANPAQIPTAFDQLAKRSETRLYKSVDAYAQDKLVPHLESRMDEAVQAMYRLNTCFKEAAKYPDTLNDLIEQRMSKGMTFKAASVSAAQYMESRMDNLKAIRKAKKVDERHAGTNVSAAGGTRGGQDMPTLSPEEAQRQKTLTTWGKG